MRGYMIPCLKGTLCDGCPTAGKMREDKICTDITDTLSFVMQTAVKFARLQSGGKLYRHPGGFWSHQDFRKHPNIHYAHWGTPTIEALVRRGVAKYTASQNGRNGEFPTEATII